MLKTYVAFHFIIAIATFILCPLLCRYFYLKKPKEFFNSKGFAIAVCVFFMIVFVVLPVFLTNDMINDIKEKSIITVKIDAY